MNQHVTDKEQIEMIKAWWNKHGKSLAVAVGIGLAIGFGWRYWTVSQERVATQASTLYQRVLMSDLSNLSDEANVQANALIKNYAKTPYAVLAALWQARKAVDDNKFDEAAAKLTWVLQHSKVAAFKQIARLRLARVEIAQKKAQQALTTLQTMDDETYLPLIEKNRGDAYLALGQQAKAKKAYESARAGFSELGIRDPILEMKLAQRLTAMKSKVVTAKK